MAAPRPRSPSATPNRRAAIFFCGPVQGAVRAVDVAWRFRLSAVIINSVGADLYDGDVTGTLMVELVDACKAALGEDPLECQRSRDEIKDVLIADTPEMWAVGVCSLLRQVVLFHFGLSGVGHRMIGALQRVGRGICVREGRLEKESGGRLPNRRRLEKNGRKRHHPCRLRRDAIAAGHDRDAGRLVQCLLDNPQLVGCRPATAPPTLGDDLIVGHKHMLRAIPKPPWLCQSVRSKGGPVQKPTQKPRFSGASTRCSMCDRRPVGVRAIAFGNLSVESVNIAGTVLLSRCVRGQVSMIFTLDAT